MYKNGNQSQSLLRFITTLLVTIFLNLTGSGSGVEGTSIGSLIACDTDHPVAGELQVVNDRQLKIKGFKYDGMSPTAWFLGMSRGAKGIYTSEDNSNIIPFPLPKDCDNLELGRAYNKEDVTLTLPNSIKEFEAIGLFCFASCYSLGYVKIPNDLGDLPSAPGDLAPKTCEKYVYGNCTLETAASHAKDPDEMKDRFKGNCPAGGPALVPVGPTTIMLMMVGTLFVTTAATRLETGH